MAGWLVAPLGLGSALLVPLVVVTSGSFNQEVRAMWRWWFWPWHPRLMWPWIPPFYTWPWGPLGPISKEQEIAVLREEAKLLEEELNFINARLAELEGKGKGE